MTSRVLVIGLDGADPDLIAKLCAEGVTPTIARLRRQGCEARLTKAPALSDDALWTSFATALPLAEHGRYHGPDQYSAETYVPVQFRDRSMEQKPFWETLSQQGLSVAALDVPKCPLAKSMNGFQLSDWLVHAGDHSEPISTPSDVARDVVKHFGEAPDSPCATYTFGRGVPYHEGFSDRETQIWAKALSGSVEMKRRASLHYLEQRDWDLFITVFKEIHCISHLYWDHLDSAHLEFDGDKNRRRGRPIEMIYKCVDEAVRQLVDRAGKHARALVAIPHGMQSSVTATPVVEPLADRISESLSGPVNRLMRKIERHYRGWRGHNPSERYDFQRSLCFPVHYNEAAGAIRINLKGREPKGKVAPGAEYDSLLQHITQALYDLKNADTGTAVVREVIPMQQVHGGTHSDNLPDLIAVWSTEQPVGEVVSTSYGTFPPTTRRIRPGNHNDHGAYIVSAPSASNVTIEDAPIEALAQLIHRLLGMSASKSSSRDI